MKHFPAVAGLRATSAAATSAQQRAATASDPNRREPAIQKFEAGENDLARGMLPDTIGAGFASFCDTIRTVLPETVRPHRQ